MILYKVVKNNNKTLPGAYGKHYARPIVTETIGIDQLAEHMASHNTPFSAGAVRGILTDMVKCVKELVLKGIAVKIDDLAIFSLGIRPKKGADTKEDFSVAKNVEGVKLPEPRESSPTASSTSKPPSRTPPTCSMGRLPLPTSPATPPAAIPTLRAEATPLAGEAPLRAATTRAASLTNAPLRGIHRAACNHSQSSHS